MEVASVNRADDQVMCQRALVSPETNRGYMLKSHCTHLPSKLLEQSQKSRTLDGAGGQRPK